MEAMARMVIMVDGVEAADIWAVSEGACGSWNVHSMFCFTWQRLVNCLGALF
jgi:hypothetical protein